MSTCDLSLGEISRARTRIKVSLIDAFGKLHFAKDDVDSIKSDIKEMLTTVNRLKLGYIDQNKKKIFGSKDWLKEEQRLKVKLKEETDKDKINEIKDDIFKSKQEERKLAENQKDLLRQIKVKKKDLYFHSSQKRQGRNKHQIIKTINQTLFERMDRLFMSKGYNGDPHVYVNALKGFMIQNKFIFNNLQDLDISELRSLNNYINSIFKSQDKGTLIGKGGRFSKGQRVDEFYDPVYAAILHDKSLNSLDIIQKTQRYTDDREKDIRIEMEAVKGYQAKIIQTVTDLLINKNIYWGLSKEDLKNFPSIKSTWSPEDKMKAGRIVQKKVHAFLNDMAEGQVRHVRSGKRYITEQDDGTIETLFGSKNGKYKYESEKVVNNILDQALNHQFGEFGKDSLGPNIDYIEVGTKRYYYVMIKEKEGKEEVYRAYYVPTQRYKGRYELKHRNKILLAAGKKFSVPDEAYTEDIAENESKFLEAWTSKNNRFGDGFYRSDKNIVHRGFKEKTKYDKDKTNEDFVVSAWSRFTEGGRMKNEDVPTILLNPARGSGYNAEKHDTLWESLENIRTITKGMYTTMRSRSLVTNKKFVAGLKLLKDALGVKQYKELEGELSNILGIDARVQVFKGRLYSMNNNIGEIKENYFPRKYSDGERVAQVASVITALQRKAKELNSDLGNTKEQQDAHKKSSGRLNRELSNKIVYQAKDLESLNGMIEVFEAKKDMIWDKTTQREYNGVKAEVAIRAGRQRTLHSDANNRRRDEDVLSDHIKDMYNDLHYNDLIADILPSLAGLSDRQDLIEYSVDHVRASVGMNDTRASIFGFDMSFPGLAKTLSNLPLVKSKYTEKQVLTMLRNWSMLHSGNLLRTSSSLTNNTQRLNFGIDLGKDLTVEMYQFMEDHKDDGIPEKIAEEAGVLDLVTSLADMLAGGFNQRTELKDGFAPLAQIALLKGSKSNFLNSKGWFRDLFTKVILDEKGSIKEEEMKKEVKLLMNNTWEVAHGLQEGTLSKKELRDLLKQFKYYGLQQFYINKYVSYGLSYLPSILPKGLKRFFTFTGVEKQMRTEAAVINYLAAKKAGLIRSFKEGEDDTAWLNKYPSDWLEPAVLEVIRTGVYGSMFGMSTNFHPKLFRGTNKLLFQFKQFPYFQLKNDWMLFRNYWNSIKGLSAAEKSKEMTKMFIPSGEYGGKFAVDKSETRSKLRRFLLTRGLISTASVVFFYIPGLSAVGGFANRFIGKKLSRAGFGFGFGNAMGRGMSSPLVTLPLQMLVLFLNAFFAIRGDEDDEEVEDASRDVYRFFLPFFINIGLEFFKAEDIDSKAEHVMHFLPGISDGSDLLMPAVEYMTED